MRRRHPAALRRRRRGGRVRDERASALLSAMVLVTVGALCLLGLSRLGVAVTQRARADAVADLSALAAVQAGRDGAAEVARSSGAELRDHHVRGDGSVSVTVQVGAVRARAAAAPIGEPFTGDPDPETGRR